MPGRQWIALGLSVALGAATLAWTQRLVLGPDLAPLAEACRDHASFVAALAAPSSEMELVPYEPRLGLFVLQPFVCLITQFLYQLTRAHPAGLLAWCGTMVVATPTLLLLLLEAGRMGARTGSPVRHPLVMGILYQVLGISVVFPLLWVPTYGWGRGRGSISVARVLAGLPLSLLMPLFLTVPLFVFPAPSTAWSRVAGAIGGPAVVVLPCVLLWLLDRTLAWAPGSPLAAPAPPRLLALAYGTSGAAAFLGWCGLLAIALTHYGTDAPALFRDLLSSDHAPAAVRFMAVDGLVLWLGLLLFLLAHRSTGCALEALVLTALFGPGAACALALAGAEADAPPMVAGTTPAPPAKRAAKTNKKD